MTCRTMRLRFLPWVWEYIALSSGQGSKKTPARDIRAIANAFHMDKSVAASVKYVYAFLYPWLWLIFVLRRFMAFCFERDTTLFFSFVKCLESLPNLHILSIGCVYGPNTTSLAKALKGVNLPQIKALTLHPALYSLLEHCPNVEDIVCRTRGITNPFCDGFLRSLMSNQDSKLKRLSIPLALLPDAHRKQSSTPWDPRMTTMTDRL